MHWTTQSAAWLLFAVSIGLGCGGGGASAPKRRAAQAPPASYSEQGKASYYADKFEGRPTASGQPYRKAEMTAAHRTLPFGTLLEVRRADGRSVVVRVNDRGPHVRGRIVDLSRRAAEELGIVREGVVDVEIRVLGRE